MFIHTNLDNSSTNFVGILYMCITRPNLRGKIFFIWTSYLFLITIGSINRVRYRQLKKVKASARPASITLDHKNRFIESNLPNESNLHKLHNKAS